MKLFLLLSMMIGMSSTAIAEQEKKVPTGAAACRGDGPDYKKVVAYTSPTDAAHKSKSATQ